MLGVILQIILSNLVCDIDWPCSMAAVISIALMRFGKPIPSQIVSTGCNETCSLQCTWKDYGP
jgi:hypothetical protein